MLDSSHLLNHKKIRCTEERASQQHWVKLSNVRHSHDYIYTIVGKKQKVEVWTFLYKLHFPIILKMSIIQGYVCVYIYVCFSLFCPIKDQTHYLHKLLLNNRLFSNFSANVVCICCACSDSRVSFVLLKD